MATKVKYTQPLFGEANAAGYLILVPGASVLIRQDGAATTVYASNAGAAMTNPVPTGVSPGTAGVDVNGTLTLYLEPGTGYDGVATVGGTSSTFTIGDISPTSADVQAPIPSGTLVEVGATYVDPRLQDSWDAIAADNSQAFIDAADSIAGGIVHLPEGDWNVQGLPLRADLYYRGMGRGRSKLGFPAAPSTAMFKTTGTTSVTAGGISHATLTGDGGSKGVGATQRGLDFSSLDLLDVFELHHAKVSGFSYGVHGSENGGAGNDRWLHLLDVLVYDNLVGLKGNEHPILVSVDFRNNDVGLTGRLNDLMTLGCKFTYNRIGFEPEAVRGQIRNSGFFDTTFYGNTEKAGILGANCVVNGFSLDGNGAGSVGLHLKGENTVLSGFRANQSAAVECETTFLVDAAATGAEIVGLINQYTAGRRAVYLATGGIAPKLLLTMNLAGGSSGIVGEDAVSHGSASFRAQLTGNGQAMVVPKWLQGKLSETFVTIGGVALTNPAISLPSNLGVGGHVYGVTVSTANGGTGVGLSVDARAAAVVGNAMLNSATMAITNRDANSIIRDNRGYKLENNGTATVASGTTSLIVAHGLASQPTARDFRLTPTNFPTNPVRWRVTTVTATQFTIETDADPGASGASFAWEANLLYS